jgi:hypothetical protein
LNILGYRIKAKGMLNVLDLHLHSENFYLHFFNLLFDKKLENMNLVQQNVAAIDLIDSHSKLIVQVSSTATKTKIESALTKDLSKYAGNAFNFISISVDAAKLRKKTYKNPHSLIFKPASDIHDIPSLLGVIGALEIERQKACYDFIKAELGSEPDLLKMESELASIIRTVAQENLADVSGHLEVDRFALSAKAEFNKLKNAKTIIDEHKIQHSRVNRIYETFDKSGQNASMAILSSVQRIYLKRKEEMAGDALFLKIIDDVIDRVKESKNHAQMSHEMLELCASVIVVDAFIRCRVFERPEVEYVAA